MVFAGLAVLFSASSVMAEVRYQNGMYFLLRQAVWAVVGLVALMVLKRFDYRRLNNRRWAFIAIGVVIVMLIAVLLLDTRHHRWIRLGWGMNLQPSEFAKPALIVFLACFVTWRAPAINSRYTLAPAMLALGLMAGLVVAADLGTAGVLVATAVAVFYVAGLKGRFMVAAGILGIFCVFGAVASKPYRIIRLIGFVDPEFKSIDAVDYGGHIRQYMQKSLATRDTGYQARQAKIAIGSGGPIGLGPMQGKQKLFYLPEAHTDFIYAVVGEELGLFGCAAVLAGFLVILYRGLRLFWTTQDDFGRYLALGVAVSIVCQAMVNMTMVLDMMPTKGIPLPMISHGGSSLLSTLTSLGMLLSVSEHAG